MRAAVAALACAALFTGLFPATAPATAADTTPAADTTTAAGLTPAAHRTPAAGPDAAQPPGGDDALGQALADGEITPARYALERARSVFAPRRVARRYGDVARPRPREATLILRDLALRAERLAPAGRAAAERILARPTADVDAGAGIRYAKAADLRHCPDHVCVHWVATTVDSPPQADGDGDGVPDQVETTAATFEHVWRVEVGDLGYRAPKSDLGSFENGGDARLDVYLADTGAEGLYGYCTSDDIAGSAARVVSAYCVVDDDFARAQFGAPPLDSLRVTAAHEFFHAVQAAYDYGEDIWLVEGTATWVEDEVYDRVNDNHRYLRGSPLARPQVPLDHGDYGPWVFFRFMSERLGSATAERPAVIREVWERADASTDGPDDYSLQAVARVSARHRVPFRELFADFGWTGPFARRAYDEGRRYPRAPMSRSHTLSARTPDTGRQTLTVQHLANRHVALRPGRRLPARRLRVILDLPARARGSEATVTVQRRTGVVRAFAVRLNRRGNGSATVAFSRAHVARVVLTLTNASMRMHCGQGTPFTCRGRSLDDGLRFGYRARAIR